MFFFLSDKFSLPFYLLNSIGASFLFQIYSGFRDITCCYKQTQPERHYFEIALIVLKWKKAPYLFYFQRHSSIWNKDNGNYTNLSMFQIEQAQTSFCDFPQKDTWALWSERDWNRHCSIMPYFSELRWCNQGSLGTEALISEALSWGPVPSHQVKFFRVVTFVYILLNSGRLHFICMCKQDLIQRAY